MKIDKRKKYYIIIDTETANTGISVDSKNALVYDIGIAVVDKKGNIYEQYSFIIDEIFIGMYNDVMQTAYYSNKLPSYFSDIEKGTRIIKPFSFVKFHIKELMEKYSTNIVVAYNTLFDLNALNATSRYLTKSKYRYFFKKDIVFYDVLKMARDIYNKRPSYIKFCQDNNYLTKHKTPRNKLNAEIVYRYLSGDNDFSESHTGLEDVYIESKIFANCMKQHKPMKKLLFTNI